MKRFIALFLSLLWVVLLFGCSEEDSTLEERANHAVATVNAVGDIFLTDAMIADARQADGSYDFSHQFENVIVALSQADLTIGNLEGNFIGSEFGRENGSYPNEFAQELYHIGFDLLQTANSYTIYNGLSGLESTKAVIEDNGMHALGAYTSAEDRKNNQVVIKDVNGVRIAFVALTKGLGNLAMPSDTQCSVDLLYEDYTSDYSKVNSKAITALLERAKEKKPDVIIAALHWGSENQEEISDTQKEIVDLMLQNGVDVVLGSHSHLVSEIETRKVTLEDGTQKDCVIAYGLGDFCAAEPEQCNTSIILNLEFTRDGETTTVSKASYTPVSSVDWGKEAQNRYCVMLTDTETELYESNYYERVSTQMYEAMRSDLEALRKKLDPQDDIIDPV